MVSTHRHPLFLFPQPVVYEAGAELYVFGNGSSDVYWFE